jgi:hypothetical protein
MTIILYNKNHIHPWQAGASVEKTGRLLWYNTIKHIKYKMETTGHSYHRNARLRPISEKYLKYAAKKQKEKNGTNFCVASSNITLLTQESSFSESVNSFLVVNDGIVEVSQKRGGRNDNALKKMCMKEAMRPHSRRSTKSDSTDLTDFSTKYPCFPPLDKNLSTTRSLNPATTMPLEQIQNTEQYKNKAAKRDADIMRKKSSFTAIQYKNFPPVQSERVGVTRNDSNPSHTSSSMAHRSRFKTFPPVEVARVGIACNDSEQSHTLDNKACRSSFNDAESEKSILSQDVVSCLVCQENSKEHRYGGNKADKMFVESASPAVVLNVNNHASSYKVSPRTRALTLGSGTAVDLNHKGQYSSSLLDKESVSKGKRDSCDSGSHSFAFFRTFTDSGTYTHSYSRDAEYVSTKQFSNSRSSSSIDSDADCLGKDVIDYFGCW